METEFRAMMQRFIKAVRPLHLQWFAACPLTGEEKGGLGTGSWVAENWAFHGCALPLLCCFCTEKKVSDIGGGVSDLSRMMLAFHCVVARLMSHDHVTQDHTEETRLCMKEFP